MILQETYTVPDFYIVGAGKAGTTSLWYYLGQHEGIYMTTDIAAKELGYFSPDYGIEALADYSRYFEGAEEGQLIGESCHAYLTSPASAEWLRKDCPAGKIIIVLRNPYERIVSLYKWMAEAGYENSSFAGALAREAREGDNPSAYDSPYFQPYYRNYLYVASSLYAEQVKRYLDTFPAEQVHIVWSEDLRKDTAATLAGVYRFLGLPQPQRTQHLEKQNKSSHVRSASLQMLLLRKIPRWLKKIRLWNYRFGPLLARLSSFNRKKSANYPLPPEAIARVAEDIERLEALTGRDLSHWKQR